jgi:hypothetical protein
MLSQRCVYSRRGRHNSEILIHFRVACLILDRLQFRTLIRPMPKFMPGPAFWPRDAHAALFSLAALFRRPYAMGNNGAGGIDHTQVRMILRILKQKIHFRNT